MQSFGSIRGQFTAWGYPMSGDLYGKAVAVNMGLDEAERWPEPQPIPCNLLPVEPFTRELLPHALRGWVMDIADRMQCPPDFAAVGAMVALSSVIGRKACIRPKRQDDWTVIPNLWGAIVGRPSTMKSPTFSQVLKPLERLQVSASDEHRQAVERHSVALKMTEMRDKEAERKAKGLISKGKSDEAEALLLSAAMDQDEPAPAMRRYVVNNATVEALGEILMENPLGVLAYRDELYSLLKSLDKEGNEDARGFYLQAYDGNQGYTFDRIMRGRNRHIPAVCLALLGGIQPARLQSYIRDAVQGGAGDDGLLQRFGLIVWPDIGKDWRNVDRWPDGDAKGRAWEVFTRLDSLQSDQDDTGSPQPTVYRFSPDAQVEFDSWRHELEVELRGDLHPALESHLGKYRKLVPALALVCSLADGDNVVGIESLQRALGWSEYLRSHAERVYAAGTSLDTDAAAALLKRIRAGDVEDGFTARTVYLKGWAHLNNPSAVKAAASLLCDLHHLRAIEQEPGLSGGRPTVSYWINPLTLSGVVYG